MNGPDGFEFSGIGKLQRIDAFLTKAGKKILTLVIETQGQYPQLVPIKVFGRMAEMADQWGVGDVLEIAGRLGGRDWNGKVYGDIIANSVEVISRSEASKAAASNAERAAGRAGWGSDGGTDPDARQPTSRDDDDVPF